MPDPPDLTDPVAVLLIVDRALRWAHIRMTPEDFVLFKLLSTRELDLEDAASVMREIGGAFDHDLVEAEARALAKEIPDHDTLARLRRVRDQRP